MCTVDAQYSGLRANAAPTAGMLVCLPIAEQTGMSMLGKHIVVVCMIACQYSVQHVLLGVCAALHQHTIVQTAYLTSVCGLTL